MSIDVLATIVFLIFVFKYFSFHVSQYGPTRPDCGHPAPGPSPRPATNAVFTYHLLSEFVLCVACVRVTGCVEPPHTARERITALAVARCSALTRASHNSGANCTPHRISSVSGVCTPAVTHQKALSISRRFHRSAQQDARQIALSATLVPLISHAISILVVQIMSGR